jgi:hypothetical protein
MKKSIRPDDTRDTRPVETPIIPSVSDIPDVTLPDINTLSLLATQPRFHPHNDTDAIRAALALWREAKRLLDRERDLIVLRHQNYVAPLQRMKTPKQWPGSFADFLRLVVQGKDEGEQLNRFRRFWLSLMRAEQAMRAQTPNEGPPTAEEISAIGKVISDHRDAPVPRFVWEDWALRFDRWWAVEKVDAKRRGGNARVAKAREKKKVAKVA